MKKVLAFGGAFNPPTIAHIGTAEYAMRETGREGVIFIPSKIGYILKDEGKDFAFSDTERLSMLQEIAKTRNWMEVTDYELRLKEQPRTYFTLCHLKETGYQPSLLIGSDWLPNLKTAWKYVDEIVQEFGIVCMARADDNIVDIMNHDDYLKQFTQKIEIVYTPDLYHNVSSTKARREFYQAMKGKKNSLKEMVPFELDGLKEYIQKYEGVL